MAVTSNPTEAAAAWVSGMSGASTKYQAGIAKVTTAPGQLAAAHKADYLAGVNAAANTWASKVAAVPLQTWQAAASQKGAPRLASGAQAAQQKVAAFQAAFIPVLTNIVNGLPAGGNFDARMARFDAYARALHAQKGNF